MMRGACRTHLALWCWFLDMMSSFLLQSPQQRQDFLRMQLGLLVLRLAIAAFLAWFGQQSAVLDIYNFVGLQVSLIGYASLSVLFAACFLLLPRSSEWAPHSTLLDVAFACAMLCVIAAQPWVGFLLCFALITCALAGHSAFNLLLWASLMFAVALAQALHSGILVDSRPEPLHAIQVVFGLLALLIVFKPQTQVTRTHTATRLDLETGFANAFVLEDALSYLLPYHQRNQMPLSLMMIQLPPEQLARKALLPHLSVFLKQRLRLSDVVVRQHEQALVLLLCDTEQHGAHVLAQHILQHTQRLDAGATVHIALCCLPMPSVALTVVLQLMEDALAQNLPHNSAKIVSVNANVQKNSE